MIAEVNAAGKPSCLLVIGFHFLTLRPFRLRYWFAHLGVPGGSAVKEYAFQAGDTGPVPDQERSLERASQHTSVLHTTPQTDDLGGQ